MRDLASAATNFRQKPCKLSLISSKLESICKIKVGKYEIKLTVFKVLLFLLRFPTYFFSYLTSFVSIDRYNLNLLANFCNNYIHVTNTRSSWATYGMILLIKISFVDHGIENEQQGNSIEICVSTYVALRLLLALSQPVYCIFWPTLNRNALLAGRSQ